MRKFLVFIPVYNEERSIRTIIRAIRDITDNVDILVIDDGSTDHTANILESTKNIHTIRHMENQGYGKTLIDGFSYACDMEYEHVITIDSDKQHQPKEINKFIRTAQVYDSDIISGSRYLDISCNKLSKAPEDRIRINRRITNIINNLTGFQLTDAFCGFKLYKVEALKKLKLDETGYGLPIQLWIQAWKKGLSVNEIPVQLIY
ncbi:MAG: glycosyltransferase family 2 protein, partial [Bacteroidota bacterium]